MKKLFLTIAILVTAWLLWEVLTFPNVGRLAQEPPKTTAFMERRKAELKRKGKPAEISYKWVAYDRISPYLRRAVLVSEDNAFYEHEGVDVEGIKEAIRRDWEKKRFSHGGSTITQQLAKNLYLSPSRNPLRKLKELILARQLESQLSKKRILEIYLNVVEMGETVYGAEAASRFYFDKSARALTPREAALLAGCLPNPRIMNPGSPNKRLKARQRIILSRMRRWGYTVEREVLTERKPKPEAAPTEEAPQPTESATPEIDTTIEAEAPEEPAAQPAETATETVSTAADSQGEPATDTSTETAPPPQ
jgi:monofunctional biosynthetic peptidoglycan transglycosylase